MTVHSAVKVFSAYYDMRRWMTLTLTNWCDGRANSDQSGAKWRPAPTSFRFFTMLAVREGAAKPHLRAGYAKNRSNTHPRRRVASQRHASTSTPPHPRDRGSPGYGRQPPRRGHGPFRDAGRRTGGPSRGPGPPGNRRRQYPGRGRGNSGLRQRPGPLPEADRGNLHAAPPMRSSRPSKRA